MNFNSFNKINMKKIYLTISAVAIALCSVAQQAREVVAKQPFQPKPTTVAPIKNKKVTTASFSGRFDPSFAVPNARGKIIGQTSGNDYGTYVDPIFCDTTTKQSFAATEFISTQLFGVTFDPKSIAFDPINYQPLLTSTDSYYLDTVWVGGVYQRRGNTVDDTLYVEVVWGDTLNTAVFGRFTYASAPMSGFGAYVAPKYATTVGTTGNKLRFTAPLTNRMTFKHVLTKADSIYLADVSNYLPIVLNGATGQLIPAGNIVSAGITFDAGGTHAMGDISYASPSAALPGTVSGWAALQYAQDVPAVNAIADVSDGYDDYGKGKNSSTAIYKNGRYGKEGGAFANTCRTGFYSGYWVDFSMHFTATVTKVNELEKNGFALNQNYPNPFSKGSTVSYQLAKEVNSALFTVTDIMGRIISSEKVGTTTGIHTVNLSAYASGVYYYSLNVDGIVTTKKMIVE